MATLRDPNRHAVMCYTSLETLAKVRTVIAGRVVTQKKAANKRPSTAVRAMGFADYFIESVEMRVADVKPSKEALAWSKKQLEKNQTERRKVEAISHSAEEKARQNRFQMKAYFQERIRTEEEALKKLRKSKRTKPEEIKAQEDKIRNVKEQFARYAESCKKYADRRRRGSAGE